MMRHFLRGFCIAAVAILSMPSAWASDTAERLDLNDCRILIGQAHQKALNDFLSSQRRKAKAGNLEARKLLAAVANNRFACYLDDLDEGAGWSVVSVPDKDKAGGEASVMSTRTVNAAAIMKSPAAHGALREAFAAAQAVADDDVAYRTMASIFVADYTDALPGHYVTAYRDAVGVREVACRYPEHFHGKSALSFCVSARSAVASLTLKLSPEERAAEEKTGMDWAASYVVLGRKK